MEFIKKKKRRILMWGLFFSLIIPLITSLHVTSPVITKTFEEVSSRRIRGITSQRAIVGDIIDIAKKLENHPNVPEAPGIYIKNSDGGMEWRELSSFKGSEDELLGVIELNSIVKDLRDIKALLENRLNIANGKHIPLMQDGVVIKLYNLLFRKVDPLDYQGKEVIAFRGGRGAREFSKEVLGYQGVKLIFVPGAVDDGRSWLIFSQLFKRPGIPDKGKCLLELAGNKEIAYLFDKRVGSLEELQQLADDPLEVDSLRNAIAYLESDKAYQEKGLSLDQATKDRFIEKIKEYARGYLGWMENILNTQSPDWFADLAIDSLRKLKYDLEEHKPYNWHGGNTPKGDYEVGLLERLRESLEEYFGDSKVAEEICDLVDSTPITQSWSPLKSTIGGLIKEDWKKFLKATIDAVMRVKEFNLPIRSIALVGADWKLFRGRAPFETIKEIGELLEIGDNRVYTPNLKPGFITAVYVNRDQYGNIKGVKVFNSEDFLNEIIKEGELYSIMFTREPLSMEEVDKFEQLKDPDRIIEHIYLKCEGWEIDFNPKTIDSIRGADLILYPPTTVESNRMPSMLVPGIPRAISESGALKILIANGYFESEKEGTKLSDKLEDEFRVMSGQQRNLTASVDYSEIGRFINYVIVRAKEEGMTEDDLKGVKKRGYIEVDNEKIKQMGVVPISIDIDNPKDPGRYIPSLVIRACFILLSLDELGFMIDFHGRLVPKP